MTVDEKIDALSAKFDSKFEVLLQKLDIKFDQIDKRFDVIEGRLDDHDAQFVAIGDLLVKLNHKVDTLIQQTSDLPIIREDIAQLKIQSARDQRSLSSINEQLIRMEEKDDYLLAQIEKISASEYA